MCRVFQNLPVEKISVEGSQERYTTLHPYTLNASLGSSDSSRTRYSRPIESLTSDSFWEEDPPMHV